MSELSQAQAVSEWTINLRRQIHRHPELMFEESQTAKLVCQTLNELGIPYTDSIAKTGVVATIGNGKSPCVALRADMDALPIQEEADVSFRSETAGKMHACGHDCHTAMLLGAAKLLKERESEIDGTIKLVFQPAEEGGGGAQEMCKAGILDSPQVEQIFGLHVWPHLATGKAAGGAGPMLAATGTFEITFRGKGGHGAMPHLSIDPIVTAAKAIVELQTIVSRESNPFSPTVVTVGSIHAGDAANVIPELAVITGTFRSLTDLGIQLLKERFESIVQGIATSNRCNVEIKYPTCDTPPTVNDPTSWQIAKTAAEDVFGGENVAKFEPILGGEDFAFYQQQVPGCFSVLGVGDPTWEQAYPIHHPKFRVDERALAYGVAWHVATAMNAVKQLK